MSVPAAGASARRSIPSLDGLRAISISFVLLAHASLMPGWNVLAPFANLGQFGVLIFFVISGYLITRLLLGEMESSGQIRIGRFYFRRTLRIFPPYFVYLGLGALLFVSKDARWWPALTYTSNLFSTNSWHLGHSWSLSVEEQFYLSWPLALLAGRRRATWIAALALLVSPAIRVVLYLTSHVGYLASTWNHDFVAAGCLLALLEPALLRSPRWQRLGTMAWRWTMPVLALILFASTSNSTRWTFAAHVVVVQTIVAIALALTVGWCVHGSETPVGRFLNLRPLRWVGIISYSLYLWQQPLLGGATPLAPWAAIPAALGVALLSYLLIERPALALRLWIERREQARASTSAMPGSARHPHPGAGAAPQALSKP
jgi:peptidoglycan/LPS O-acetylase OafA/YrhL